MAKPTTTSRTAMTSIISSATAVLPEPDEGGVQIVSRDAVWRGHAARRQRLFHAGDVNPRRLREPVIPRSISKPVQLNAVERSPHLLNVAVIGFSRQKAPQSVDGQPCTSDSTSGFCQCHEIGCGLYGGITGHG
jgi:hypothetical protein